MTLSTIKLQKNNPYPWQGWRGFGGQQAELAPDHQGSHWTDCRVLLELQGILSYSKRKRTNTFQTSPLGRFFLTVLISRYTPDAFSWYLWVKQMRRNSTWEELLEFHLKAWGSIQEHSLTISSMSTVLDVYNLISLASHMYSWALDDMNAKSLHSC